MDILAGLLLLHLTINQLYHLNETGSHAENYNFLPSVQFELLESSFATPPYFHFKRIRSKLDKTY